jgi:hypothetical protein
MFELIKKIFAYVAFLCAVVALLVVLMVRDLYDNPAIKTMVVASLALSGALFSRVNAVKTSDSKFKFKSSKAKMLGLIGFVSSVSTMIIIPEYDRYWYKDGELILIVVAGISVGFGSMFGYMYLNSKKFQDRYSRA